MLRNQMSRSRVCDICCALRWTFRSVSSIIFLHVLQTILTLVWKICTISSHSDHSPVGCRLGPSRQLTVFFFVLNWSSRSSNTGGNDHMLIWACLSAVCLSSNFVYEETEAKWPFRRNDFGFVFCSRMEILKTCSSGSRKVSFSSRNDDFATKF